MSKWASSERVVALHATRFVNAVAREVCMEKTHGHLCVGAHCGEAPRDIALLSALAMGCRRHRTEITKKSNVLVFNHISTHLVCTASESDRAEDNIIEQHLAVANADLTCETLPLHVGQNHRTIPSRSISR